MNDYTRAGGSQLRAAWAALERVRDEVRTEGGRAAVPGRPNAEYETDGNDMSVFATVTPSYDEVLAVRAERVGMVREFLGGVTVEELATVRSHPWAPEYPETTLSCLHTILEEEWEHHRYAVRDLDTIEGR
ncbi:DinB family protein [Kribbella ginsengisoli]